MKKDQTEFEVDGSWWDPCEPEIKWIGRLTFSQSDGATLRITVDDPNNKDWGTVSGRGEEYACLVGDTLSGPISLLNCFVFFKQHSGSGLNQRLIYAESVIRGIEVNTSDPIINGAEVLFDDIHNWIGFKTLEITDSYNFKAIQANWTAHEPITIYKDDALEIKIYFTLESIPMQPYGKMSVDFAEEIRLHIKTSSGKPLTYYLSLITSLQDLITIGMLRLSPIKRLELFIDQVSEKDSTIGENDIPLHGTYHSLPRMGDPPVEKRHYSEGLFDIKSIGGRENEIMGRWIALAEEIQPVRSMYYDATYNSKTVQARFLNYSRALEVFHRWRRRGIYINESDYKKLVAKPLIKAIPDNLDEELLESLSSRIRYGNEYSLRKRLIGIFNEHAGVFYYLKADPNAYSEEIVKVRNHLTHYSGKKEIIKDEVRILLRLNLLMRIMLELSILNEIGLADGDLLVGIDKKEYSILSDLRRMLK